MRRSPVVPLLLASEAPFGTRLFGAWTSPGILSGGPFTQRSNRRALTRVGSLGAPSGTGRRT